jgi:hypothetical protein
MFCYNSTERFDTTKDTRLVDLLGREVNRNGSYDEDVDFVSGHWLNGVCSISNIVRQI